MGRGHGGSASEGVPAQGQEGEAMTTATRRMHCTNLSTEVRRLMQASSSPGMRNAHYNRERWDADLKAVARNLVRLCREAYPGAGCWEE